MAEAVVIAYRRRMQLRGYSRIRIRRVRSGAYSVTMLGPAGTIERRRMTLADMERALYCG